MIVMVDPKAVPRSLFPAYLVALALHPLVRLSVPDTFAARGALEELESLLASVD